MTDEERRILTAAFEGRLRVNRSWRYIIDGEPRPDRKARESLQSRGFLGWDYNRAQPCITAKGCALLEQEGVS